MCYFNITNETYILCDALISILTINMFRFRWLRRLVRRHTNPIEENTAEKWQKRLSFAYFILASNVFIGVGYMCYSGRADWADYYGFKSPEDKYIPAGVQWSQTLGLDKAKYIRFSGFKVVEEYDIEDRQKVEKTNSSEVENISEEIM